MCNFINLYPIDNAKRIDHAFISAVITCVLWNSCGWIAHFMKRTNWRRSDHFVFFATTVTEYTHAELYSEQRFAINLQRQSIFIGYIYIYMHRLEYSRVRCQKKLSAGDDDMCQWRHISRDERRLRQMYRNSAASQYMWYVNLCSIFVHPQIHWIIFSVRFSVAE